MKSRYFLTLPLAASMIVPAAFAQQNTSSSDQKNAPASQQVAPAAQTQSAQDANGPNTNNDTNNDQNRDANRLPPVQAATAPGTGQILCLFGRAFSNGGLLKTCFDRVN